MDVKHGLVEDYSSDGHLFTQGNYVDGKRDGVHKNYFENSKQIHKIHIFKKGKLVGQNITYFKNGGVEKKASYKNDRKHGASTWYFANSKIVERVMQFSNGVASGIGLLYYKNGNVKKRYYYGTMRYKQYDKNGKKIKEGKFSLK